MGANDLPRRTPGATISPEFLAELDEPIPYVPCDLVPQFSSQAGVAAHQYSPTRFGAPIPSGGAVTKPNPAPSDDTTPSLVRLDQADAAQRLAAAAATLLGRWNGIYTDTGVIEARNDLRQALADFRWVS